ncbi:MAG: lipocalin-like domain-containing protein [Woeseiaceae bacterium]
MDESVEELRGGSRLAALLGGESSDEFPRVIEPLDFEFPRDHGPHADYRNEWWYVTGNLDGPQRQRFGFELTFFRFSLAPENDSEFDSAWQTNQVYIAHFAITDVTGKKFHVAQRYARGSAGLAGARANPFKVWLDEWSISAVEPPADTVRWKLHAADADFSLELELAALKQPVLNGLDGLSQKSEETGNASYYYSLTRLQSHGNLRIGDQQYPVTGLSWLDREWGSSALSSGQRGWDWFAMQLSDGSELMFYNIRRNDNSADSHSAGTWIDPDGTASYLRQDEVSIVVTDRWDSPRGGTYPAGWIIGVPGRDISLRVRPVLDDQELATTVRYWEGAVDVDGRRGEQDLTGRGYVELTGYAAE